MLRNLFRHNSRMMKLEPLETSNSGKWFEHSLNLSVSDGSPEGMHGTVACGHNFGCRSESLRYRCPLALFLQHTSTPCDTLRASAEQRRLAGAGWDVPQ